MALHRDLNGNLHDDMDGEALHMLPAGCVQLNTNEIAAIHAASNAELMRAELRQQIISLESGQARAVREAAIGLAGAQARLVALDAQIAAIRAQMMAVV